jgi:tRNA nucleotidyltransferase/poly(A) polymerase
MPDYIYLLENRLSADQQSAIRLVTEAARSAGMNVFLAGGAVRDLTSGASARDLDFAVQGNALKLKKALNKNGTILWGEHEPSRTLFYRFPASVRVEISSTRREEYPKPGKPVYHWANILEDLRRRDFTANAMALSLNEGSYGLLMDPLNGVADIEQRLLRLVSNYGFLEDPTRLLRATRFLARLGWEMDERTKTRFQNAKEENAIEALSSYHLGYELEEIGHEEDGLEALNAMEREGWMPILFPAWTHSKADVGELHELRRVLTQLQMHGVNPDHSAASMQLLTAKLPAKDLNALKKTFVRPGFVEEWNHLDDAAKEFAKQLGSKEAASPSATWKLMTTSNPQAVLWLGLTSKSAPIQAKYKNFFTVWPEAKQKIPYLLMQELRITQDIPRYQEMLEQLFFSTIDGKLETEEQLRAFLQPYSPPAPPPPVTVRRTRASKKTAEPKSKPAATAETAPAQNEAAANQAGQGAKPEHSVAERKAKAAPAAKAARKGAAPLPAGAESPAKPRNAGLAAASPAKKPSANKSVPAKSAPAKSAPVKAAPAKARPLPKKPVKAPAKKPAAPAPTKKHAPAKKAAPAKKSKSAKK